MDRRYFLQSAGASAVAASFPRMSLAAPAGSATPRMPLSKFVTDPGRVAALKRGVKTMKDRKPSEPTSWFFQAAIHGVPEQMVADALKLDPNVAKVDRAKVWNQCPHFGNASSADFPIWHRAYVYYFERILRAAAGDPSLSLPYWDYSDPQQRGCPSIFADPDIDPTSTAPNRPARNPLYDARREQAWVRGLFVLSDAAVSTTRAFQQTAFFGTDSTKAFGGAWNDLEPSNQGQLERSPHNGIHFAIGGVISTDGLTVSDLSAAGLMADPTTAGFDPIFWVHHSNIDRLWNVWARQKTSTWGPAPADDWLDAAPWWFYDADSSLKQLPRRSYVDDKALGVTFEDDDPSVPSLSSTPISKSRAAGTSPLSGSVPQRSALLGSNSAGLTLSASAPTRVRIALDAARADRSNTSPQLMRVALRRVILELEGVSYDGPPSVGFELFASTAQSGKPTDLGPLNLFGLRHGTHMHMGAGGQRFDVTALFAGRSASASELELSVEPFDLLAPGPKAAGAMPPRRAGGVKIAAFKLLVEAPSLDSGAQPS